LSHLPPIVPQHIQEHLAAKAVEAMSAAAATSGS
jgi:hypothetical protein